MVYNDWALPPPDKLPDFATKPSDIVSSTSTTTPIPISSTMVQVREDEAGFDTESIVALAASCSGVMIVASNLCLLGSHFAKKRDMEKLSKFMAMSGNVLSLGSTLLVKAARSSSNNENNTQHSCK